MADKMRQGKRDPQRFYVHEMLAGLRNDPIPQAFKERHTKTVSRHMFKPKRVFERWMSDDPEILQKSYQHDVKLIPANEITLMDQMDAKTLLQAMQMKYSDLKEVFHYLQQYSTAYPRVDILTLRNRFVRKLAINTMAMNLNKIDIIISTIYSYAQRHSEFEKGAHGFSRHMFIELVLRLAKFTYASDLEKNEQNEALHGRFEGDKDAVIRCTEAFELFYPAVIEPFIKATNINWTAFRDANLNDPNVELVFTMNMPGIESVYKYCSKMHQPSDLKKANEDFMIREDCIQLLHDECLLRVPKDIVGQAFAMCKMTVTNDTDPEGLKLYRKLTKVEFLEFISRVADLFFHESEMEDLQLYEKIEHVLDEVFPLVGATRVRQRVTVEEFSESDDDY